MAKSKDIVTVKKGSPTILSIKKIVQENENVRTFTFEATLHSLPGMCVMLWVPGYDQKPYSIGNDTGDTFELTIFELGHSTQALFRMKEGDKVGISGPFGSAFRFKPNTHVITVSGGYGAAPLGFLTEKAVKKGCTIDFLIGARREGLLLFEERAMKAGATVHTSTDDGSKGYKGYITDVLEKILQERKQNNQLAEVKVLTCGPELMEKKVAEIAQTYGIPSEVSIERYMKCGFGICGNCCVDDEGITTCQYGPVISGERALQLKEFGQYHRDKYGIRQNY